MLNNYFKYLIDDMRLAMVAFKNTAIWFPKYVGLFLCMFLFTLISYGQDIKNDKVTSVDEQRAVMVLNLTEEVKWSKISQITTFKIGVMGPDTIKNSLSKISKNRRIFEKLIQVDRINKLEDIKNYNVVYVNSTYEYLLKSILEESKGLEVLIITEGYPTNSSMINMVQVDDSYKYDINRKYIREAKLKITPILAGHAVTSKEIKESLYKKTEQKLYIATRENKEQKKIIESQIKTIGNQINAINEKDEVIYIKDYSLKTLAMDSELKAKQLAENLNLERELEKRLDEQINQIINQQNEIDSVNNEILNHKRTLEIQTSNIKEKTAILEEKNIIIDTQRKHNIILSILSGLLFIACLSLLFAYVKNKKLNIRLSIQHKEIKKQSTLLTSKNKELEQFAYIASHDLQEPLNTVSSFIDVLSEDYHNQFDEDGQQILGFIKEGSVRMKKLIDALLQYSRLGRTKVFEDVNCMPLLDVLTADLQSTIKNTEAEISYKDLPIIKGNEVELRLLFQNLITNGIKFRDPNVKPRINIECTEISEGEETDNGAEKYWKFSVTDNGIGIAKEYQDRVFAIFQRLHSRLEYEGSGIGLAHCKKIVESHSGKIWFTSEKGMGTTFCFSLPMSA